MIFSEIVKRIPSETTQGINLGIPVEVSTKITYDIPAGFRLVIPSEISHGILSEAYP